MADRTGQRLGNYQLLKLLGQGGFAEVYLGKHVHLDTLAAIKVLHTRLGEDSETVSFQQEARIIAQLVHPHIVRILDYGLENALPFLIMDYAPSGSLRQRMPTRSRQPLTAILPYVQQIADALDFAHSQRIIHRDIKPENILFGRRDEVLLTDFGIAVVAQSSRSQGTQDLAGTITYMAPEQIQGHPRAASDQYALGVIVYEWLCGQRPFDGTMMEIAVQKNAMPPKPLHDYIEIAPAVEQVILRTLAIDPAQRFPNVTSFANELQKASQEPVLPRTRYASAPTPALPPTVAAPRPDLDPTVVASPQQRQQEPAPARQALVPPPPPGAMPADPYAVPPVPQPYYANGHNLAAPSGQKARPPALLPFLRGGLQLADLFVLTIYCGLLFGLPFLFGSHATVPQYDAGFLITLIVVILLLNLFAPALLGSWRAGLAVFGFALGTILTVQRFSPTYTIPGITYISLFALVIAAVLIGRLYENRKSRSFLSSWTLMILVMICAYISLVILVSLATDVSSSQIGVVLLVATLIGLVLVPLMAVIFAAIELLLQSIAASLKKRPA